MVFHWVEIIKFIKNNIFKLLAGIVAFTVLFTLLNSEPIDKNEVQDIYEEIVTDKTLVKTDAQPAKFYFYIRHDDGRSFNNYQLIEQFILSSNVLLELSTDIDVDLVELIEETDNQIYTTQDEINEDAGGSKIIGLSVNQDSNLMEFYTNVGDEQNNLSIANYFYQWILSGELPFVVSENISMFKEPFIVEEEHYDVFIEKEVPEEIPTDNWVSKSILGAVIGLILTTFVLWVLSLFSKQLKYSFSYLLKENDVFLLLDSKNNKTSEARQIMGVPVNKNKIIICDNTSDSNEKKHKQIINALTPETKNTIIQNVSDIQTPENIERLIYVLIEDKTDRTWYKKQRSLDKYYDIPTFVIQINKSYIETNSIHL